MAAGAGKRTPRRRPAGAGVAAFGSPAAVLIATLALIVQLLVLPYHQARSAPLAANGGFDVAAIAGELRATFGDAAALCVEADDKGAPMAPAGDCDDHCPLCHFAAQATALVAPDRPALPERFDSAAETLAPALESWAPPSRPSSQNRARAPPFAV